MTDEERLTTVCGYFCDEGLTAVQIQKRLQQDHSEPITREKPYEYLRKAISRGWIRFVPPQEHSLEQHVRSAYPFLQDAVVVKTARAEDVAYRGAKALLELLQQHYVDEEVHIGFSGGTSLRMLARRFAELLREPVPHLPSKIVFHALVAGFDVSDPATDPNAFFIYFLNDPVMPFETSFVALHTPAMVPARFEEGLRDLPAIKEAYDRASEIDIFVTSTSCWTDEHSMLRHYMAVAGESVDELEQAGCIGDILWQPIGADGPFELNSRIRAMTIMRLDQLSNRVAQRKHVLLVAGPCHKCHAPKTRVVRAILDQQHRLITHLVTDSRCARAML
jgi:DNA-binding transcriptional regulator LsrR (DeoR family)